MPETASDRLWNEFGLRPVVATEIEFYLPGAKARDGEQEIIASIYLACEKASIRLARAEAERGPDQYEVSFLPSENLGEVARQTEDFKSLMASHFAALGINADFRAKPFRDAPGSGLHVHVHLEDKNGRNVFFRDGEEFSPHLLHSIGGLLERMNPSMPVFAPRLESYDRFVFTANSYLICPTQANVPLTVSWGTNNRTTAIRLPNKPADHKHIEHRVAGSDADVKAVMEVILDSIHYGLTHQSDPGAPVYGDASLPQYKLSRLALSLDDALAFKRACET